MAQPEPMDVDCMDSEFDNKENSYHQSNVLHCTEKGYEELDVSELNMKLRYSMTPTSSPMSKSYTVYVDSKNLENLDSLNGNENVNLTRSLNSTMSKNDSIVKSLKCLPLQALPAEKFVDGNGNPSALRPQLDTSIADNVDVTVTVSGTNDIDENLSLASSSSSALHTPATTPTMEMKNEGSPIMRGLKTVLNMFRSSQSPIPPAEEDMSKQEMMSSADVSISENAKSQAVASTPIAAHRIKEGNTSRRSSPLKDSIVFNDDLEKELNWKDETTILFSDEKIPIHKLFFQQTKPTTSVNKTNENMPKDIQNVKLEDNMNSTVEYMDISYNESLLKDKTITEKNDVTVAGESDSEFVDCETTFNKADSDLVEKIQVPGDNTNEAGVTPKPLETSLEDGPPIIESIAKINENLNVDITSLSFTETDQNNVSVPSDYSRETTEILFELDKIEASVSPNVKLSNVLETPDLPKQVQSPDQNLEVQCEIMQPEVHNAINITNEIEKKGDGTEEYNTNITQAVKHEENSCEVNSVQQIDDRNIAMQNTFQSNPVLKLADDIEISKEPQITDSIKNCKTEDPSHFAGDNLLSTNSNDTLFNIRSEVPIDGEVNVMTTEEYVSEKDDYISDSIETLTNSQFPSEVPLPHDQKCDLLPSQSYVEDNLMKKPILTEIFQIKSEIEQPADVSLPDEDDIEKDITAFSNELITESVSNIQSVKGSINEFQVQEIIPEDKLTIKTAEENVGKSNVSEMTFKTQVKNCQDNTNTGPILNMTEIDPANLTDDTSKNEMVIVKENELMLHQAQDTKDILIANYSQNIMPDTKTVIVPIEIETKLNVPEENNIKEPLPETVKHSDQVDYVSQKDVEIPEFTSACHTACNAVVLDTVDVANSNESSEKENYKQIDITLNEKLNQTHALPDIVNEVITVTGENVDITRKIEVVILPQETVVKNVIEEIKVNLPENVSNDKGTDSSAAVSMPNDNHTRNEFNENTSNNSMEDKKLGPECTQTDNKGVQTLEIITEKQDKVKSETADEEIMVSGNNSPYVSLMASLETAPENIDQNLEVKQNPSHNIPSSPPIKSSGYNFNFDEMDDAFATNSKIRKSPTLEITADPQPEGNILPVKIKEVPKNFYANRRKSQPVDKKRTSVIKKKLNTSLDDQLTPKILNKMSEELPNTEDKLLNDNGSEISDVTEKENLSTILQSKDTECNSNEPDLKLDNNFLEIEKKLMSSEENKESLESITSVSNDAKPNSLEQSTYYSAGTSSTDSSKVKNVFNLPEIDDVNFNPFATKSKMRPSPQHDSDNPFLTRTKVLKSPDASMIVTTPENLNTNANIRLGTMEKSDHVDKMDIELMEKDTSANISATSAESKASDNNLTVHEVNTEDEDTEEGPFLEADDVMDKIIDFNGKNDDMMQFNELPAQDVDDNMEGELFIDAEAFEYLLNKNKSNVVADSGKESLFLKFDPLFAKRMSNANDVLSAINKVKQTQSTPTKLSRPSLKHETSPIAGPSNLNITYEGDNNISQESNDELNVTVSKPTMVVTPAVNPVVTPRTKTTTPNTSNRRSITFTSPAIAVIDRLLSMSSNNSFLGQETTIVQSNREQNEAEIAITQLRELLAEKEISVYNLRSESKELKDRLANMETQLKILEADGQSKLKKINELNERLAEKTKLNKSMAAVVEEYERTIASLIAETEQDKKRHAEERIKLINERDEQTAHLASMEVSFSDLHSKYEKSKQVILACRSNEESYKKSIKEFEENLNKMQTNYELLKQHATSKLNHANQELERINRSHEAEVVKLNAMIKRKDLHITSLEETLSQKTKANEELTAICDDLINKVGLSN